MNHEIDRSSVTGSMTVAAPAKVNLRLKVVGRRADGYHLLSMLNVTTALHDEIRLDIAPGEGVSLSVLGEGRAVHTVPSDVERNLASRAALRILGLIDARFRVTITIRKRIPTGGGLGGGSSDAAAVLRALSEHLAAALPASKRAEIVRKLPELAAELGADVPYSLLGGPCLVSGIGEIVRPLESSSLEGAACVLAVPPVSIPTPAIFARFRELRPPLANEPDLPVEPLLARGTVSFTDALHLVENDLEAPVLEYAPDLARLLAALRADTGIVAGVTGSGSTLFVLSRDAATTPEKLERQVAARLASFGDCSLIATTLTLGHRSDIADFPEI